MDYINAFQSLKTNNKYARKSPHKAVLLLAVIDMFENKLLSANEIRYDECLLKTFQKVWNKVLPNETTFFTNVYFPFWYMQSDGFWFNVPVRGKEDIFRELWESRAKPNESRIKELIQYAILDEGLYFMMTMPSGRSALKRALLEEYTELSEHEIDQMCVIEEVELEDKSTKAMKEYQAILNAETTFPAEVATNNVGEQYLHELSDNLQIALNYEYYSFLKSHRVERDLFREIFPSVRELVYRIMKEPYKQGDLNYSFATIYENFLGDLRVALMSEDDSISFIDNISSALASLQGVTLQEEQTDHVPEQQVAEAIEEPLQAQASAQTDDLRERFAELYNLFAGEDNRKGKSWSIEEEEFISQCYEKGWDCTRIGKIVGRTPLAIYVRLTNNLGYVVDDVPEGAKVVMSASAKDDSTSLPILDDFRIENKNERCFIYNARNECVFSTSGSLKLIRGKIYRFNYKPGFFTVKAIERNGDKWYKGTKLLVARASSDLYRYIERHDCSLDDIEDFIELSDMHLNQMKFVSHWYDFDGNRIIE